MKSELTIVVNLDPDQLIDHADHEAMRHLAQRAIDALPPADDMPPVPDHLLECFEAASMTLWIMRNLPRLNQAGAHKGLALLVSASSVEA